MLIVGIGGTTRVGSTSEIALRIALGVAAAEGADVRCFAAGDLQLPLYEPCGSKRTTNAAALLEAVAAADALIVSTPGYHGSLSGLVKNALDYVEDLRDAEPPYLEGKALGCISVAHGWQTAVNTLRAVRDVGHALRAWPIPYGAAINSADGVLSEGQCAPQVEEALRLVATQCVEFAARGAVPTPATR